MSVEDIEGVDDHCGKLVGHESDRKERRDNLQATVAGARNPASMSTRGLESHDVIGIARIDTYHGSLFEALAARPEDRT